MKKIYVICAIFLILSFILNGCKKTSQEDIHPSNHRQLAGLIGKTMSNVCKDLDVTQEELLNPAVGLYVLPDKIDYLGHSFEILLSFDITTDEKTLYGFCYRTTFKEDVENAAIFISDLSDKFTDKYDEWNLYAVSNRITEQTNLAAFLDTDDVLTVSEVFDLSNDVTENINEYKSSYKNQHDKTLEYGMVISASTTEDAQVILTLKYEMKVNPNK